MSYMLFNILNCCSSNLGSSICDFPILSPYASTSWKLEISPATRGSQRDFLASDLSTGDPLVE